MKKIANVSFLMLAAFLLLMPTALFGQNISQRGKVVDSAGDGIPGAYVVQANTTNGTVTDIDGNFTLSVPRGSNLEVSFMGYKTMMAVANGESLSIVLEEDAESLEEVLMVGYATGKKMSMSGAVERVTADQLNVGFLATPMDAIRAKVSGLVISQNGGNPTGTPTVRLRGTSSLTGETGPLFIIDGMFADVATFAALNAADIAEVTVLKDAAETAQYGSRGASGVIVVTTQKGKAGEPRVDYNGQLGLGVIYKRFDVMSADEWRDTNTRLNEVGVDHGYSNDFFAQILNPVTVQHNHDVSLTMGSQRANTRASIGVNSREGQVKGTENTLYNMRVNSMVNALNDKLVFELGFMGSYRTSTDLSSQRLYTSAAQFNPTFANFRNPETGLWDRDPAAQQITHPLGQLEQTRDSENFRISTTGRISYKILPGLTFAAYGSFRYNNSVSKTYIPNNTPEGESTNGSASLSHNDSKSLMGNLQLTYVKEIGKSSINFLALSEAIKDTNFSFSASATGFDTNYFKYNNLRAGANVSYGSNSSSASENVIISYLARLNYMFDNRYVITLNARADGSSKLGADHKWGFFPSVSGAWIVSNEKFMKNLTSISNLKFRVGYGVSGNQNGISAYRSLALMNPSSLTTVNGANAVSFAYSANDNPDLQWETKYTLNAGVDFSMFKSRLRMSADYYQSTTKNLLYSYSVPVPPFLYSSLLANIGVMTNHGFEFSIGGDVIRTRDWGLALNGQMAFQNNKLVSLSGEYKGQELNPSQPIVRRSINDMGGLTSNTGVIFMSEGMPLDYILIPEFEDFVVADNGHKKYKLVDQDGNGRVQTTYTSPDRVFKGQATPKVTMGASIQLQYKTFDFTTQLSGAFGHMIYNATNMLFYNMANFPSYNVLRDAPNQMIYDIVLSDYWLEKGDYVNIDYMSLGWNAPIRKWTNTPFHKLRMAVSCNNVKTFTKYSGLTPLLDIGNGSQGGLDDRGIYPVSRTFMFSLQFGF